MTSLQLAIASYMRTHSVPAGTIKHDSFGAGVGFSEFSASRDKYAGLQQCMRNSSRSDLEFCRRNVTRTNSAGKLRYCIAN